MQPVHLFSDYDLGAVLEARERMAVQAGERIQPAAIAVNDQWRVCFRFIDGDADDVEICDYH